MYKITKFGGVPNIQGAVAVFRLDKPSFKKEHLFKFILFCEFIDFFLLLNYQIIATEKILQFVSKNIFWSMRSRMSRILYLKLKSEYQSLYA